LILVTNNPQKAAAAFVDVDQTPVSAALMVPEHVRRTFIAKNINIPGKSFASVEKAACAMAMGEAITSSPLICGINI
jgi:hypothetical protein